MLKRPGEGDVAGMVSHFSSAIKSVSSSSGSSISSFAVFAPLEIVTLGETSSIDSLK